MDKSCSLLVRQTIVGEPERRDDYRLARGGGKHLDRIPASRLATRLELLRNTLRPTPHVQLAMREWISLPNSSMSTWLGASRTAPPTGSSSGRPSEVRSAKRQP